MHGNFHSHVASQPPAQLETALKSRGYSVIRTDDLHAILMEVIVLREYKKHDSYDRGEEHF